MYMTNHHTQCFVIYTCHKVYELTWNCCAHESSPLYSAVGVFLLWFYLCQNKCPTKYEQEKENFTEKYYCKSNFHSLFNAGIPCKHVYTNLIKGIQITYWLEKRFTTNRVYVLKRTMQCETSGTLVSWSSTLQSLLLNILTLKYVLSSSI